MKCELLLGNCLEVMDTLEPCSVHSIVTDPPYGLSFMGKDWDHGVPGAHFWIEALRVAKPGAHLLAFGGTRTFHRLAVAIEDAGWEIRDTLMWVYGSGFPKSHDVSKAIDKEAGVDREVIGRVSGMGKQNPEWNGTAQGRADNSFKPEYNATAPATDSAKQWDGFGTALKPAWEPIILARKPLEGTVAQNVLKYGCGALNIDGCRVPVTDRKEYDSNMTCHERYSKGREKVEGYDGGWKVNPEAIQNKGARWPANLIHDGSDEVMAGFPHSTSGAMKKPYKYTNNGFSLGAPAGETKSNHESSEGSAARFFYCAKASKQDRDEGCENLNAKILAYSNGAQAAVADGESEYTGGRQNIGLNNVKQRTNFHPTVKPTALMRYLCKLVTPPNGTILDPFMGSGSTGKAAMLEGFSFTGIELQPEYIEIARSRINHVTKQTHLL